MLTKAKELSLSPIRDVNTLISKEKSRKIKTLPDEDDEVKILPEAMDFLTNSPSGSLIKNDEKLLELMIDANDKAAGNIQKGNCKEATQILEKMEKLLENAANCGKIIDRNLVIVILYNTACAYQAMWVLDKCSKYTDGVIYNLLESIKTDEMNHAQGIIKKLSLIQLQEMKAIKLKKQHFLLKIYLQHCAVLSQLSKHQEALELVKKANETMECILKECQEYTYELKKQIDSVSYTSLIIMNTSKSLNDSKESIIKNQISLNDSRKISNSIIFRDEVQYLKILLDYAIPFLDETLKNLNIFAKTKNAQLYLDTKKSIFIWKNNPENNEKYLRKEFTKGNNKIFNDNRSLLGVQKNHEWLETLNIGTIMHMKPMKYHEYACKKEFMSEITKESLQEKIIFQSLICFTTATEMRFIEIADTKEQNKKSITTSSSSSSSTDMPINEGYKESEYYHLKAIELVCKYINGPCPFINHLITSYQKHYNQNLESIPEESFYSNLEKSIVKSKINADDNITIKSRENSASNNSRKDILHELSADTSKSTTSSIFEIPTTAIKDNNEEKKLDIKEFAKSQTIQDLANKLREEKRLFLESLIRSEEKSPGHNATARSNQTLTNESHNNLSRSTMIISKSTKANTANQAGDSKKFMHDNGMVSQPAINNIKIPKTLTQKTQKNKVNSYSLSGNKSKTDLTLPNSEIPLKDEVNPKYLLKITSNVPNVNISHGKSVEISQSYTMNNGMNSDKKSVSFNNGFKTERIHNRIENNIKNQDSDIKKDNQNNIGVNFYFYKNFNKFIQNLYVQDDQIIKAKFNETRKEDKLAPYKKALTPGKTPKANQIPKRPLTSLSKKSSSTERIPSGYKKNEAYNHISQTLQRPDDKNLLNFSRDFNKANSMTYQNPDNSIKENGKIMKPQLIDFIKKGSNINTNISHNINMAKSSSAKNINTLAIENLAKTRFDKKEEIKFYSPRESRGLKYQQVDI